MKKVRSTITSVLLAVVLLMGIVALPALADGEMLVGEVTITSTGFVNVRSGGSTDYPIIYRGESGELFQTTGQVAGGWYEILLPDGTFGYISDKLVFFYRYPTPVPLGAQGAQATVPVYYMNTQGQTIRTVSVPVKAGQNVITADDNQMPGYRLVSTRSVYVFVDAQGRSNPTGVIFQYEQAYVQPTLPPVISVNLPIYYKDVYNRVIASELRTLKEGAQLVKADAGKLPQGYYVSGASDAVVVVSNMGVAAPSELSFIVSPTITQTPPPVTFSVPVVYQDDQGRILHNTSATVQPGYTTVTANDSLVAAGLTLSSSRSVVVYCSNQGVTFPSTVTFTYNRPVTANIQVTYQDTSGNIFHNETRQLGQGNQTITADDARAPYGYTLQGSRSVQVTVYANGTVSQNQVTFIYALPVQYSLPIEYRDNAGTRLHSETQALSQGTTTITANDGKVPSGYVLQNARSVQVTVYSNGTANPDRVVFLYARPVSANVSIVYRDSSGNNIYTETRTYQQGSHTVTADDGRVQRGYVLQGNRSVQITVDAAGNVNPSQVVFTYAPPAPPVTVNVPVIYKDYGGATLHQTTVSVSSAEPKTIQADMSLAPAGFRISGSSSVRVTVSANGTPNPAQVVFTFRDPSTITEAGILPKHQTFSYKGQSVPVYSGPGTNYYRAANGKAALGGGSIRIFGKEGDWVLIGYGLSNNLYRIGYIERSYLPVDLKIDEMYLGAQPATVVSEANITDDPISGGAIWLTKYPVGTKVTLLAYEDFVNHWAYLETTIDGKPFRGFVNKIRIKAD